MPRNRQDRAEKIRLTPAKIEFDQPEETEMPASDTSLVKTGNFSRENRED
jgi:hypothetical protein